MYVILWAPCVALPCMGKARGQVLKWLGQDGTGYGQRASVSFDVSLWSQAADQCRDQHCSCVPSTRHPGPYGSSQCPVSNTCPVISPWQRWVSMFLPHTAGWIRQWRWRGCTCSSCWAQTSTFSSCCAAPSRRLPFWSWGPSGRIRSRHWGTWNCPPLVHMTLSWAQLKSLLGIPVWLPAGACKLAKQCLRWAQCCQHSHGQ